jgi:hypothetical protein
MTHTPPPLIQPLIRRHFLQGTLRGVAGLAAWQPGWLRLRTAAAPAPHTAWADDLGGPRADRA